VGRGLGLKLKWTGGAGQGSAGSGCANTALAFHAGKLLALHEADLPYALRMSCAGLLETIGRVTTYTKEDDAPFTAHPKVRPPTRSSQAPRW
jgi:carotenoid cleavage dioxygenase-like enzyme